MNFETALSEAKKGNKITRVQFNKNCYIVAKYPTETSQNTLPYLQMHKKKVINSLVTEEIFPLDLSCESIFAEDWYVTEENIV